MTTLDPDERTEVHNARIAELCAGEISGREFIISLMRQCALSEYDAKLVWQDLHDRGLIAIHVKAASRLMIEYPIYANSMEIIDWRVGMITSLYGNGAGAIVQTALNEFSLRVPFALFELRLAK